VAELGAGGAEVSYLLADVSRREDCERMAQAAADRLGSIDVLCANAGIFPDVKLADMTEAQIDQVLGTNLKGCILSVQACLPSLAASGRGRVILTSSITGPITGFPGWSHYGASKAAQLGFMRTAAIELASRGITANVVAPGFVDTDMTAKVTAVPRGEMALTRAEAEKAAHRLFEEGAKGVVVKAQIHAGGRGKGGGVKLARSADETAEIASQILGMNLVTAQTGPQGRMVKRLLIEEGLDIKRELYLGLLIDRETGRPVFMASASGGMEIEQVAKENPGAILREHIHPAVGLQPYQARKIAFGLGLTGEQATGATPFFQALYRAFIDTDASMVEINPCVVTGDGKLVALDAKVTFDDNALFRHKDLRELRDLDEKTLAAALAEVPAVTLPAGAEAGGKLPKVADLLAEAGIVPSKSEARRAIAGGGAYLNNVKVPDADFAPQASDLLHGRFLVLRRGKRTIAGVQVGE
jgi:NAD(P)-dependent dehydrogenase (short-subunit alcohol dehydrogenase family)